MNGNVLEQRFIDTLDGAGVPDNTPFSNIKGYTFNGKLSYNVNGFAEITVR